MKHKKLIDRITEIAEELDWKVDVESPSEDVAEFTFSKYTDLGQDFSFSVEMTDWDMYDLIQKVDDYYEGYEPEAEAMLWLDEDGHGKNGAPYHMRDVLADMEQCESMIKELLDTLAEKFRTEKLWHLAD